MKRPLQEILPGKLPPPEPTRGRCHSVEYSEATHPARQTRRAEVLTDKHAALRYQQQLLDEIGRIIRPPQPQEPEVIVIEQEPDPHVWAHRWW
jgi:hypothetical protein